VSILEFLGFGQSRDDVSGESPAETETVRRIVDRLDHLEPERARFVAAFAYVLSRVAHADLKISEDETADRSITTIEDNVIRQIATELRLEHKDFIGVRSRYRDHLAVLQDPRERGGDEG
jgi:uncharacterized tellurite resistance protein B-like protein